MAEVAFDENAYQKRKRGEHLRGWLFTILGGLILVDSGFPVPIPLVGISSLLVGGGITAYGIHQLFKARKLPLRDALQLGRALGGHLTRTELFLKLNLSPSKTDELLDLLVAEGFIEIVSDDLPEEQEVHYRLLD